MFSAGAAGCGVVNYDIFENATVRAVPLFVQYKDRLYPQMGTATACVMLQVNSTKVHFAGSPAIIPARDRVISIPTYLHHSKAAGQGHFL